MGTIRLRQFADRDALTAAAAEALRQHIRQSFGVPHAVMLSGGQTPQPVYATLAGQRLTAFDSFFVLFSDERMVPADAPENNCHNASPMIAALGIPDERTLRVHTEMDVKRAAARYDADLRGFFKRGGRITLGFLGLGADGHTASLFSAEDVARGGAALAVSVRRRPGPDRVSVTPTLLKRVEALIFLVGDTDKHDVVQRLVRQPDQVPAGLAVQGVPNVQLWFA
jgi:6-phosphogluconolactonase